MAATWNRYSKWVLVAAGLAAPSVPLWLRPSRALLGLDAAEILAAVDERAEWAMEMPALWFGTNRVGAAPEWKHVYGQGLSRAREILQGGEARFWLDASAAWPAHGDAWIESFPVWTNTGSYTTLDGVHVAEWTLAATALLERAACAAAVAPGDGQAVWPMMAGLPEWAVTSRAPFAAAVSGYAAARPAAGGWWARAGNGATNYLYACEQWPAVRLRRVYGGPAGVAGGGRLHIWAAGQTAEAALAVPAVAAPRATVFETDHRAGVSGDGLEQRAVVWASPPMPSNEVWTSTPVYALAENQSGYPEFLIRTPVAPGMTNPLTWEVVYRYGNLDVRPRYAAGSVEQSNAWFRVCSNNMWGYTRQMWARASNDADRVDGTAVYRIGYLGEVYEFVFRVDDGAGDGPDLTVSPATHAVYAGNTNLPVAVSLSRDTKTWPPVTGKALKRIDLEQALNVLSNLTRSAAVIAADNIIPLGTNSMRYIQEAAATNEFFNGDDVTDTDLAGWCAAHYPGADVTESYTSTAHSAGCILRVEAASRYQRWEYGGDSWGDQWLEFKYDRRWADLQNVTLPYPPPAALASGLVARVSVFALLENGYDRYAGTLPTRDPYHDGDGDTSGSQWFYRAPVPDAETAQLLLPWAAPAQRDGRRDTSTPAAGEVLVYGIGSATLRLTHVATVSAPAEPVAFDFSLQPDRIGLDSGREWGNRIEYENEGETRHFADRSIRLVGSVRLLAWVVVVDWDWRHCNPARPYTPPDE